MSAQWEVPNCNHLRKPDAEESPAPTKHITREDFLRHSWKLVTASGPAKGAAIFVDKAEDCANRLVKTCAEGSGR